MGNSQASISNHNYFNKCVRYLNSFFFSLLYSLLPEQSRGDAQVMIQQTSGNVLRNVKQRSFNLMGLLQFLVQTGREVVAGALTKTQVFIQTRKVSGRFIVGLFLAGCFAVVADVFYAFDFLTYFESFRRETRIPGYYYSNYRYLFLSIGPYMSYFFAAMGIYFMSIPGNDKKRFILIPLASYPIIKIIWLWQVTSHDEFHAIPPYAYWIYGVILSSCLWLSAEYLVYLFNHKLLNGLSTLSNITNNRDKLPAEQAVEMYATTCEKLKSII